MALLVVNGSTESEDDAGVATISRHVETRQIAPTILSFLGLDPDELKSVRGGV